MTQSNTDVHVLIVDDHPDTVTLQAMLLQRQGHEVSTASSAAEAVSVSQRQPIDLLISDIRLPDRSGVELMRELRPRLALGGIAITGAADENLVQDCLNAGYARVLVKPVTPERLLEAVAHALHPRED